MLIPPLRAIKIQHILGQPLKVSMYSKGFISQLTFSVGSLALFVQPPCAVKIRHILGQPSKNGMLLPKWQVTLKWSHICSLPPEKQVCTSVTSGTLKKKERERETAWYCSVEMRPWRCPCVARDSSPSPLSVQTLLWCSFSPRVQSKYITYSQPLKMECDCPSGRWIQNSYIYHAVCLLKNRCATYMKRGMQKKKRKKLLDVAVWRWGTGQAGSCARVLPCVPDHPHWQRLLRHTR